jgi:glucose-1-phosphate adenylyltransferase
MPNVTIGENVHIERSIIASNCVIEDGAIVGNSAITSDITLIGENQTIINPNKKKITHS